MPELHIGIVGSGGMARGHAKAFSAVDGAKVVGIASRNGATGDELARDADATYFADWHVLCARPDVDAIVICTHNDSHGSIAIDALHHDKHVYVEYPLARSVSEGQEALDVARSRGLVLRVSHREPVSSVHRVVKETASQLGELLLASFLRVTPGSGGRPEILFNVPVSGPPAHFFIYHVFPIVDLFGPAAWVEGGAAYEGLREDGRYDRFANTVNVGFRRGGIGQWAWAGGIDVREADQSERCVMTGGTLIRDGGAWHLSTRDGVEALDMEDDPGASLQEHFIREVREGDLACHGVAETALDAIRISLGAETSMNENRRVTLI